MGGLSGTQMRSDVGWNQIPPVPPESIVFCWWKNIFPPEIPKDVVFQLLGSQKPYHIYVIWPNMTNSSIYTYIYTYIYMDFPWHKPWHISVLMTKSSTDGFSMFFHQIKPCQLLWYPHFRKSPALWTRPQGDADAAAIQSTSRLQHVRCGKGGCFNDLQKRPRKNPVTDRWYLCGTRKNLLKHLWVTLWLFNIAEHGP